MARFSINNSQWNIYAIILLFGLLWIILSIDKKENHDILDSKLLKHSRQVKNVYASADDDEKQPIQNEILHKKEDDDIPIIYAITPTYYRLTQMADLTRMSNTLRQIKRFHWIVVEDWKFTNHHVHELLQYSNLSFTYFAQRTRKTTTNLSKGIDQRNAALRWIEMNHDWSQGGVIYFADDDNAYDLRIFKEMRYTKKISMWPVGLAADRKVERPIVVDGKVKNFSAWWSKHRVFPIDMAGFAVNVNVLWDYYPMRFNRHPEYCCMLETAFLELCCTVEEIEPLANNCTKVYVWHTRTNKPDTTNFKESYEDPYV